MGEGKIIRRGGGGKQTAAPSITVVSTSPTGVTFTLTNNDDNTAIVSYGISTTRGAVELAASATSSNITVDLAAGTYTLTAYATVVGEVATQSTETVEIIVLPTYELLYDSETANNGNPIPLPTTQIDITGLNIGKDDTLRLVYSLDEVVGSPTLYANDFNTDSFYTCQRIEGEGSNLAAARFSIPRFAEASSGVESVGFVDIKVSNNDKFVFQSQNIRSAGAGSASMFQQVFNVVLDDQTVSSITKLSIKASTNGIGVGSKIALYKVTEAA